MREEELRERRSRLAESISHRVHAHGTNLVTGQMEASKAVKKDGCLRARASFTAALSSQPSCVNESSGTAERTAVATRFLEARDMTLVGTVGEGLVLEDRLKVARDIGGWRLLVLSHTWRSVPSSVRLT